MRRLAFDHSPLALLHAIRSGVPPPYDVPAGRFGLVMQIRDGQVEVTAYSTAHVIGNPEDGRRRAAT